MTENVPPIPPATQAPEPAPQHPSQHYPPQPPEGYGQPASQAAPPQYAPSGYPGQPQAYGQPQGGYPAQGYGAPGAYVQPQPGSYEQRPGQWVPAAPTQPKSSGSRVASGIVEIVLGLWLVVPTSVVFRGMPFLGFLFLIALLGNITAGIILLVKHRGRAPGTPVTSLAFAGFAALLSLIGVIAGYVAIPVFTLPLAIPVLIIMGLGLARERRSA